MEASAGVRLVIYLAGTTVATVLTWAIAASLNDGPSTLCDSDGGDCDFGVLIGLYFAFFALVACVVLALFNEVRLAAKRSRRARERDGR